MSILANLAEYGFIGFNTTESNTRTETTEAYKRIEAPILCQTNDKLSIFAEHWTYVEVEALKLSIRAETQDNLWIETTYYSMSEKDIDTEDKYKVLEQNLISSWLALNGETDV